MRQTKLCWNLYSWYDHTGLSAYLEGMARRGWMLERIDAWGWHYRRMNPRPLRFSVVYDPDASAFDPDAPSPARLEFRDYCAEAGWKEAAAFSQLRVFYNEDESAVPIETDAAIQVETVHRAMLRGQLFPFLLIIGVSLLVLTGSLWAFFQNPLDFLSSSGLLMSFLCWMMIPVLALTDLFSYFRWRRRAVREAEQGRFLPTRSHPGFQKLALLLTGILLLSHIFSSLSRQKGILLLVSLIFGAVIFFLPRLFLQAFKHWGVPAYIHRAAYIAFAVLLIIASTAVLIMALPRLPMFQEEAYEYQGHTFYAYQDSLPLTVADLGQSDDTRYSTHRKADASFVLSKSEYTQMPRIDAYPNPSLEYTVLDVHIPVFYGWCRDLLMESLYQWEYDGEPGYWTPCDAAPWKADSVWRACLPDGSPLNRYLFCRDRRIVDIQFSWEPAPEQMAVAGEKFGL